MTAPVSSSSIPAQSDLRIFERGDEVDLARALLAHLDAALVAVDEGNLRAYRSGVWVTVPREELRATVASFAGSLKRTSNGGLAPLRVNAGNMRGAVDVALDLVASERRWSPFDRAPRGVAFANAFVVVEQGEIRIREHAPENMARFAYPFDYDPSAPHALLHEHLNTVFDDVDASERAARVSLLQEFVGASLIGEATSFQSCLVLASSNAGGGEGKGTTIEILRSAFPPGSTASLPPHVWSQRFQLVALVGKLANFVDELPGADLHEADVFKKVITGDPTFVDVKNRPSITFKPLAGHIFACNALPGSADLSEGFFRRFIPIVFGRQMHVDAARRRNVAGSVIANELPGLVAWCIEGAARAQRQGRYTMPEGSKLALARWRVEANPVLAFLTERPVQGLVSGEALYQQYREWARKHGHREMSSTKFGVRAKATSLVKAEHTRAGTRYYPAAPAADARGDL